ncbi:MAG: hypothetical protein GX589_06955 [Deltaproteobacteria bacterium]|nr:hypothetical protein [Deltaproteobacteria bacterium]
MLQVQYDLVYAALRTLFLSALPVIVAVSLAGTLIAALQSATAINDPAVGYAARLLALLVALYLAVPPSVDAIVSLAQLAFR